VLAGYPAPICDKGSAQVACARPSIESDLRCRCANPAQRLPGEFEVQQAGHDARDFVRLVETPLDEPGRVQWHGDDQRRTRHWVERLAGCMRSEPRAEDSRVRQRTLVLEGLHQLGHRKLVYPRCHAPGVRQVERVAAITADRVCAGQCVARQATALAWICHDRDFRLAFRAQVVRRALAGTTAQDAPWWQHPPDPTVEKRVNLVAAHWLTASNRVRILPGRCPAQRGPAADLLSVL